MKKQCITTFEEAVQYLYGIPRFTSKNSMEDTKQFLHRMGDPDGNMKILHVAGTNGKGSVCAYLRHILEAAGKSVALFTSPHLVDVRERFLVRGEMVSKEAFLRAFQRVYELVFEGTEEPDYHPTFFEYLFFMAMLLFDEAKVNYCILETGLGGRLDATNAVTQKELCVITHISLDHVEYLGDTVSQIAGEKAGIIRRGTPVVFWDTCAETTAVFDEKAIELDAPSICVSKSDYRLLSFNNKSIDFSVSTRYYKNIPLTLHTIAAYQMENAALAVRAVEMLDQGRTITRSQIQQGIANCFWAGRMEEILPSVYVDGAHNEDGVRAFLESVVMDGCDGRRSLLFSVVADKDYEPMIRQIVTSGAFERIYLATMSTGRAISKERLAACFEKYPDCSWKIYDTCEEAFGGAMEDRRGDERLYIAGSLYLVGEIKELLRDD